MKLHDTSDIAGCQYYGTANLKRIYRSSKLKQPGETIVSGETGLPLRDKGTQSGDMDEAEESGQLMDVSLDAAEGEIGMEAANTQTQGNQFDSLSQEGAFDANSGMNVKTEPVEMENQEQLTASADGIATSDVEQSGSTNSLTLPGTSSPVIGRVPSGMTSNVHRSAVPISPKPYQCSICQKTFRSIQILQKHTLTFHSRPKMTVKFAKGKGKGRGGGIGHGSQYFRHQQPQDDLEPKG